MFGRHMHVGLIAPPWVSVPPPVYGGTELVVDELARGLDAAGHRVTLFTTGDSTCPVERRWLVPKALGTHSDFDELTHVRAAYDALRGADVIHDHTLRGPAWAAASGIASPVVATVHGELSPASRAYYEGVAGSVALVAISHDQRRSAPTIPFAAVIHHGIEVARYPQGRGDGGYVLFLGRMSPDKGVHRAIRVARAAGKRLLVAAKMWEPDEHRYFVEEVAPLLGRDVTYLGPVSGAAKLDLLAGAEALVNPIRWPEPFGLVMIEALATGTPVVTFAEGAAPEIVDHGRTGFLCCDEDDMVRKLGEIADLDRSECRRAAEARFSAERMVDDHVALYHRVIAARSVPDHAHRARQAS